MTTATEKYSHLDHKLYKHVSLLILFWLPPQAPDVPTLFFLDASFMHVIEIRIILLELDCSIPSTDYSLLLELSQNWFHCL